MAVETSYALLRGKVVRVMAPPPRNLILVLETPANSHWANYFAGTGTVACDFYSCFLYISLKKCVAVINFRPVTTDYNDNIIETNADGYNDGQT